MFRQVPELATYLASKQPKWPVALTTGIPNPDAVADEPDDQDDDDHNNNNNNNTVSATNGGADVSVDAPAKGHQRSGSGDNGFKSWTPPVAPPAAPRTGNVDPVMQGEWSGDSPTGGIGAVQKRNVSKTWRRQKLSDLESKPTVLGQWAVGGHGSSSHSYVLPGIPLLVSTVSLSRPQHSASSTHTVHNNTIMGIDRYCL